VAWRSGQLHSNDPYHPLFQSSQVDFMTFLMDAMDMIDQSCTASASIDHVAGSTPCLENGETHGMWDPYGGEIQSHLNCLSFPIL
jgi:hypothetical protein